MLFNSLEYFIFFIVCLIVAWRLTGFPRIRIWFLLLASLYFYYSNNHWQILLLLFATTVDYVVSLRMQREREQARRWFLLCISVVSNLGLLCYFKYINFLADTAATMAAAVGLKLDWVDLNVVLPVGISFYTFEALSYTIDVYRGKIPAERRWSRLAFLVSFFPHLIAGPIVRAATFFPQMDRPPRLPRERLEQGLFLISTGLFKKMLLADTLAIFADRASIARIRSARSAHGSASMRSRSRSISTSAAIPISRWAARCCSGSSCRRISIAPTSLSASPSSGVAGI